MHRLEGFTYRVSIPDLADFLINRENIIIVLSMKIDLFDRQVVVMIFD